jgi:hypothetical protein
MFQRLAFSLLVLAIAAPTFAEEQAPKTLRVYFVGNSVTDTINYRGLTELAKSRGYTQVWGRQMIPGAPLQWIWEHPKDWFQEQPFGHYPTALANFQWDVLSLQPFDRHLDGKDGDIVMAKNFIDLALKKSPELQVYVYARWPRQQKDDFDTAWLKTYTGKWDGTNETKDYFERLTVELRKAYPKLKIHMVPVGHVMYELNQRMKAGKVPGYTDIKQLFADGIHLNNVGSYVVGCTYFATLYKQNPVGLSSEPYKVEDAKLAAAIQDVVWKVVSTHEMAGVTKASEAAISKSDPVVHAQDEAVEYYMSAHRDPAGDLEQQGANHQQKPKRPLLVMTWFLRSGTALRYNVTQKGKWFNVRNVYDWASQDAHGGQLSAKELANLRGLLPKLPKSAAKPPIERTVVVSCERDGKWCTETYDSSHIPETLERVMLIVGERFETKDRKRESREAGRAISQ